MELRCSNTVGIISVVYKERNMTVYLSGPVTGTTDYKQRFDFCEEQLRKKFTYGNCVPEIINPVRMVSTLPADSDYEFIMQICLMVLDRCDGIVLMPGWRQSIGCNQEYGAAMALHKEVYLWEDLFT